MNEQIYIEQDKKKHTSFLDSEISIYIGKKKLGNTTTSIFMALSVIGMLVFLFIVGLMVSASVNSFMHLKDESIIASERTREEDVENIEYILGLNEQYYNVPSTKPKIRKLKNYNMHTDKFTFPNFGSYNAEKGMCLGFSLYEKMNYTNELSAFSEEIKGIYDNIDISDAKKYDISTIKYENIGASNIEAEVLYNLAMDYYNDKYQDFFTNELDKKTAEVLSIVNYFQKEGNKDKKEYPVSYIKPNRYKDSEQEKVFEDKEKNIIEQFSPNLISNKIDADEPVIIGLHSASYGGGHAVMGYGYEQIGQDIFKLYVSDSNIVFKNEDECSDDELKEVKRHNYDVENNVYILFVKDQENGKWNYIYNPKVNGTYVYQGKWNSFIPSTYMIIFE